MRVVIRNIALIIILSLFLKCFSVSATDNAGQYMEAVETLQALNILEGYDNDLMLDKALTRAEFVTLIVRVTGANVQGSGLQYFEDVGPSHWAADNIALACNLGLIQGYDENNFAPDDPVTYEEAVKVIVSALGYEPQAKRVGGYPLGFLTIAIQHNITQGVQLVSGQIVKRGMAAKLIFNALDVEIVELTEFNDTKTYGTVTQGKTLLSEKMKIRKGSGILEATSVTNLIGRGSLGHNEIKIGGETLTAENLEAEKYLGYSVIYYVDISEEDEPLKLVYVRPNEKKNTVLTVNSEDISEKSTVTRFVYEGDKKENYMTVSDMADMIYNGVGTGGFTAADMKPLYGTITLLDNNGDGVADVLFINDYETIVVGGINAATYSVYDMNDMSKYVNLDPNADEYECAILENGEAVNFSTINNQSVLSVAESKNTTGKKNVTVLLEKKTVTGELAEMTDDGIIIDGIEYKLVVGVHEKLKEYLGHTITCYIDAFGNIAGFDKNISAGFVYGYLIDAAVDKKTIEKRNIFTILTQSGSVSTLYGTPDKLILDGRSSINGKTISCDGVITELAKTVRAEGMGVEQLIRYRLNSSGKIREIDSVAKGVGSSDKLSKDAGFSRRRYISAANSLGFEKPDFIVDNNIILFLIPENDNKDETVKNDIENYTTAGKSYFESSAYYMLEAYDFEEAMTARVCVITRKVEPDIDTKTPVALVDKIVSALNDNGEEVHKLTAFLEGKEVKLFAKDKTVLAGYKQGDLIRISKDMTGVVVKVEPVLNPQTDLLGIKSFGSNPSYYFSSIKVNYGYGVFKNGFNLVMATEPNDKNTYRPYLLTSKTRYFIYYEKAKNIKASNITELENYLYGRESTARIALVTTSGNPLDIIIYDFKQ